MSTEHYDRAAADTERRWHDHLADLVTNTMSDVAPEDVRWLRRGRVLLSKLTVPEGDPKGGKSRAGMGLHGPMIGA